ncbi:MAG: hypothetical protein FJY97_21585, partial [candidate division Zixibacteria bacterium]|nr:hypothetical protein [candidate division Zixibacteria bacterium]
ENPNVAISITSNEPINGLGDGDTGPDWNVVATGNGSYQIYLRAERAGNGSGRVYTIRVTATDASGNASSAGATVSVPKSQKK